MRIGVYPGTFDPITKGHMDVIQRALGLVDKLVIAIAQDTAKTPVFSLSERVDLVRNDVQFLVRDGATIDVLPFGGLLVDFAKAQGATLLIRGLRAVSDFEYEFQLASMNTRLNGDIQTIFLPASENRQFVASKLVKEVARLGGDVSPFVSEHVSQKLQAYYKSSS